MGWTYSAVSERQRGERIKFTLSRAQHDALLLVTSEGIERSIQPKETVEKARQAVAQMKRQDERQKMKKGV